MAKATQFNIVLRDGAWVLTRDGRDVRRYVHADHAVHYAADLARELNRSGQPAAVHLQAADGLMVEVTPAAEPTPYEDPAEERSAVVPSRSPSG